MTHGIAREGFDKDLLFGLAREDAFAYSFFKKTRAEHKADEKAKETGNFYLEYETSSLPEGFGDKYPSGISVCTAELWVTEFRPECWVIVPTDYMRKLVYIAESRNITKWGGDYNRFHGALISWRWLLQPPAPRETTEQMTL